MWTALGNFTSAVTLSTPVQSNISISPTNNDGYAPYNTYWHSAEVSSYIQAGGSGYYTVGNVQCTFTSGAAMAPSWTLMVAYKNQNLPYRYVTVNTGFSFVAGSPGNTFTISNFVTPYTGTPTGYLLMAYTDGDFGDSANLRVGATTSSYTAIGNPGPISSPWNGVPPYNPQGQMFPGLICIADPLNANLGNIDTRGNFGNSNLTSYVAQTYNTFSRTLYDISGFNISKALTINQNTLNINVYFTNPTGGAIIQNESVQVDVQSANLAPLTKSVSEGYGTLGDTLIFTVTTANIGLLPANNVIFIDTTPNGTTFQPGSVIVNNVSQPTYDPNPPNGISLGTIAPNAITTIIFSAKVNASIPFMSNPIKNQATLGYSFVPGTGISPVITSVSSNTTTTTINFVSLSSSKIVNKSYANIGDVLTYTIPITNNGTITATNVGFIDTIPNGTVLLPTTIYVNGIQQSGAFPSTGITIPNIAPGTTATINFSVQVQC